MNHRTRPQHGVSLIEALVAMAVMAIGMLGLVGVQSTLRGNSDIAKQRSEAVRLAQAAIEEWRGFAALDATAGVIDYADLAVGVTADAAISGANATYTRTRAIAYVPVPTLDRPYTGKSLTVEVAWVDRTGEAQAVHLSTAITGIAPELAATLSVPADGTPIRLPHGRNRGIPLQAIDLGGGRSGLIPPGAPAGVAWRFDNVTGVITFCTTTVTTTAALLNSNLSCGTSTAALLSGYVRYSLGSTQPTAADAQNPVALYPATAADPPLTVTVLYPSPPSPPLTASAPLPPPPPPPTVCYTIDVATPATSSTSYLCAIPVVLLPNSPLPNWSGTVRIGPASKILDPVIDPPASPSKFRLCRYFDPGATYTMVSAMPLVNQNYLAIRGGDGTNAFSCPATGPARTWPFQP